MIEGDLVLDSETGVAITQKFLDVVHQHGFQGAEAIIVILTIADNLKRHFGVTITEHPPKKGN